MEELKLLFDFKNKNLPIELLDLFKLISDINSHITRNVSKGGIFIPQVKTTNFGIKSLRYSAAVLWNNFIKANEIKITEAGSTLKITLYTCIRKTKFISTFIFSYIIIIIVSIIVIIIIIVIILLLIIVIIFTVIILLFFL